MNPRPSGYEPLALTTELHRLRAIVEERPEKDKVGRSVPPLGSPEAAREEYTSGSAAADGGDGGRYLRAMRLATRPPDSSRDGRKSLKKVSAERASEAALSR